MDATGEMISAKLTRSASEDRFSGAVLVRAREKVLFAAGFGDADRERKIPNTRQTRFRLGSLNKMFTATATLRLVQDGTLSLELRTCEDYVRVFGARAANGSPGARFRYCTYGYILLGRLLELASGSDYYELVNRLVFAPAGMEATGSLPEDVDVPDRAVGYMRASEGWRSCAETLPYRGTPGGGGYSTVDDLDRFATALSECRLLDEDHTGLLTTGQVAADDGKSYAFGFMVEADRGTAMIGHSGGAPGMAAVFHVYPGRNWRVIVLSNRDRPAAGIVAKFITAQLFASP